MKIIEETSFDVSIIENHTTTDSIERERKFLVESVDWTGINEYHDSIIVQTYLDNSLFFSEPSTATARIRARYFQPDHQKGPKAPIYTQTTKHHLGPGKNLEIEREISKEEYDEFLKKADPNKKSIRKERTCFNWDGQDFELDFFMKPRSGLQILEIELEADDTEVRLPPFIKIIREVTSEKEYSNAQIAQS